MKEELVIANIMKIRAAQGLTKREVAEGIGLNEASYGRIENGKIALSYNHLALLASVFRMRVIDILTYPKVYVPKEDVRQEPLEAVLQIHLKKDKRDQVLKLVFGDNDLEILNK